MLKLQSTDFDPGVDARNGGDDAHAKGHSAVKVSNDDCHFSVR